MTVPVPPPETLSLSEEEAVAVGEVALAYAAAVPTGRDGPYRDLAAAAAAGEAIDGPLLDTLERVCVLALETGKARQLGRAETERLVTNVYRRTRGGRELQAEANDVNRVLAQLVGRPLTAARLTWRLPGRYHLDLGVSGCSLSLVIEPDGLQVQSLQTG